jgi:hypothetical protein
MAHNILAVEMEAMAVIGPAPRHHSKHPQRERVWKLQQDLRKDCQASLALFSQSCVILDHSLEMG